MTISFDAVAGVINVNIVNVRIKVNDATSLRLPCFFIMFTDDILCTTAVNSQCRGGLLGCYL